MKTAIIVLAIVIGLSGAGIGFYHNKMASTAKDELNRERYSRMVAEEDLLKSTEKVTALEKEVTSLKTRVENSEKMLNQTMSVKNDLQNKLDDALNAKDSLEQKVKELTQAIKEKMTEAVTSKTGDI